MNDLDAIAGELARVGYPRRGEEPFEQHPAVTLALAALAEIDKPAPSIAEQADLPKILTPDEARAAMPAREPKS